MATAMMMQVGETQLEQMDEVEEELTTEETPEEEEKQLNYHHVQDLQNHGISIADVNRLAKAGYCTIESVAFESCKKLSGISGVSEVKIKTIQEVARQYCPCTFSTAAQELQARQNMVQITTGSTALDNLLNGGIETGSLTELYGEFRTGKTQLCHTLCVTSQLSSEQGGGEGKAMYIDTEGTFRPDRLQEIAERFGVDKDEVLENVVCARAYNTEHQTELLKSACGLMSEDRFVLLVVDSATALYRTDYIGRGQLSDRQVHLALFLRQLTRMAMEFGIAVVLTNQVVANPDGNSAFGSKENTLKPIGGNIIAHASHTRLSFRKAKNANRICRVIDSPVLPESEAPFSVSSAGIDDATG
uniref:DNA repair protein RAD51 homolog n=1 Tax=Aureoumbra lagunensis TaxID=44058 RepID=A0A7S3K3E3_9STRA|mmetsp:Transcript_22375/g.28960  ORF Transcript_22375/g.28960 Transcript_22375/m.28960 type:complete len:359 (+) Transcript_22375:79-1155(+)